MSTVFQTCNPRVAVDPPQGLNISYIHYCPVAVTVQPETYIWMPGLSHKSICNNYSWQYIFLWSNLNPHSLMPPLPPHTHIYKLNPLFPVHASFSPSISIVYVWGLKIYKVGCQLFITETEVHSQCSPCGICSGQRTQFLLKLIRCSLVQYVVQSNSFCTHYMMTFLQLAHNSTTRFKYSRVHWVILCLE
jgi:hypothetical protein